MLHEWREIDNRNKIILFATLSLPTLFMSRLSRMRQERSREMQQKREEHSCISQASITSISWDKCGLVLCLCFCQLCLRLGWQLRVSARINKHTTFLSSIFSAPKKYHLGWGWFMPRSRRWTLSLDGGWEMDVSHIGVMCSSVRMQCPSYLQKKANVPLSELTRACFWEAHSYALPEGFRERMLIRFQGVLFPLFCGCSQRSSWPTHTKKAYTENKDFKAESLFFANLSQLLKVSDKTFLHKDG